MSLCNTYRSFAIYLVIVFIISESPVSAFTIQRMKTTTLKSLLDLTGEESALLEAKSDLSKLNDERDNIKYGRDKVSIRKPVNFLAPDKKFASNSRKSVETPTTVSSLKNNDDPDIRANDKTIRNDTETTTSSAEADTSKMGINSSFIEKESNKAFSDEYNQSNSTSSDDNSSITNTGGEKEDFSQIKTRNATKINTTDITTITNEHNSTTEDTKTSENAIVLTTSEVTQLTTVVENDNYMMKDTGLLYGENIAPETTEPDFTLPQIDISTLKTESIDTKLTENTGTDATGLTESMISEPSQASTNNPIWKKYTSIERKRITFSTEAEPTSTDTTEELDKAESVSSKITLENDISVTPVHSLEELRQESMENFNYTTRKSTEDIDLTTQPATRVLETEINRLPATESIGKETTTEAKADFVESKRAGYLDFSAKQGAINEEVTSIDDITTLNETELLGSIFEIETQEDGPDVKNTSMAESQSQLADDAIKEELLKEEVLNDHVKNSKLLEEHDLNKVKPLTTESTDDSLSVKPITNGKGSLYAVNSNYRKMKKIDVQPARPFVRDPDDNSWRNESLTSLGIVFKAKNASKPFTQVLKNKTEAELFNIVQSEKENNNEVPDLRQRLEKITEVRKSRKKKIEKFGDTIYSDYEEASGEASSTPKTDTVSIPYMEVVGKEYIASPPTTVAPVVESIKHTTTPGVYIYKEETVTTKKPKKINKFAEYYDTTDEYDADYINLSKIDLKKFTTRLFANNEKTATTSPMLTPFTKPMKFVPFPDRKPTVQYFPPRRPPQQKVNVNDYDSDFQRKVNMYTVDKTAKDASPVTYATPPPATVIQEQPAQYHKPVIPADTASQYKPANLDKNVYVTFPPRVADHGNRYSGNNDESFNRASYVIKHYRDLIDEAVKDDYDKSAEYIPPFTEAPLTGVTMNKEKVHMKTMDEDYDYDANFRKDIINRFVDNFNQNSERFKVDFPILYNNTVVHMKAQEGGKVVASSSAFMKRLYGDAPSMRLAGLHKPCDPHCEMKVELSPAYELHYYVPEQEEKEEAELKPATLPFSYRL